MSEAANIDIARRGFAAVARGDLDAVTEFLDPAVEWHGGDRTASGACQNRDQVLAVMSAARGRRGLVELVDVVGAGEQVVVILRTKTGLHANVTTFRAGKAIEMVHYPRPADAFAAMGMQPPSGY